MGVGFQGFKFGASGWGSRARVQGVGIRKAMSKLRL